jgi:TIR domain/NB-ARC domain
MGRNGKDVFVSYAGADRAWAEWAAWHLRESGYSVELNTDWATGDNFVLKMNDAVAKSGRILMLWSPAYFDPNRFTTDEWTSAMSLPPEKRSALIPVRVAAVDPPVILGPLSYLDVFDLDEERAVQRLLEAVGGRRDKNGRPEFPGTAKRKRQPAPAPRLPGLLPEVWNVPRRSRMFTGRNTQLLELRERLTDRRAVVQAVHGMGGVGKTTLAIEYAHRFAGAYGMVWWIDAEQPSLIGDQLVRLGVAAGWLAPDDPSTQAAALVRQRLRTEPGWLLIFDNADRREDLLPWLPEAGQVLVTSRNPGWQQLADPLPLPLFTRSESVALLQRGLPSLPEDRADELAERLGDLPLAVMQATGWISETAMPVAEYLALLEKETALILSEGKPDGYPAPLAAVIQIAMQRLQEENEAAAQLLRICAFLAPEPVPTELFVDRAEELPQPLADMLAAPLRRAQAMRLIGRYGLADLDPNAGTLQMHRLTQLVLQDSTEAGEMHRVASDVLAGARPDDGRDPVHWPRWSQLISHLTALDPATSDHDGLRELACHAVAYLIARGDLAASVALGTRLYRTWQQRLGPDARQTLSAGVELASALAISGELTEALTIGEDV